MIIKLCVCRRAGGGRVFSRVSWVYHSLKATETIARFQSTGNEARKITKMWMNTETRDHVSFFGQNRDKIWARISRTTAVDRGKPRFFQHIGEVPDRGRKRERVLRVSLKKLCEKSTVSYSSISDSRGTRWRAWPDVGVMSPRTKSVPRATSTKPLVDPLVPALLFAQAFIHIQVGRVWLQHTWN
jgi:hypothetical protein